MVFDQGVSMVPARTVLENTARPWAVWQAKVRSDGPSASIHLPLTNADALAFSRIKLDLDSSMRLAH
jgi:hypothetical protein